MPYPHEVVDTFDEMLDQSRHQPLVFGIALHAFLVGQPFRRRALRRAFEHLVAHRSRIWLATTGGIAGHFAAHRVPAVRCRRNPWLMIW